MQTEISATPSKPNDGLARAAIVCGVLSLVPGCCCAPLGFPVSIVAIAMGLVSLRQMRESGTGTPHEKNMAIVGVICGSTAIGMDLLAIMLDVFETIAKSIHGI